MAIKTYKPVTPGRRGMTVTDYSVLSKVEPERSLLESLKKNSGRNSYGRITVRHKGGAQRRKYRVIDFKRNKLGMDAEVMTLEYDPNRSAFIALIQYEDGEKRYIIAPDGLNVGDKVRSGSDADIKPGNALALADIPVGTVIHNIELYPGKGGQLVRSAGNMAQLMAKENGYALLRLPSGELRNAGIPAWKKGCHHGRNDTKRRSHGPFRRPRQAHARLGQRASERIERLEVRRRLRRIPHRVGIRFGPRDHAVLYRIRNLVHRRLTHRTCVVYMAG